MATARHDRITEFTNRLPRDYRPSMQAVGAAADAMDMLIAARPLHAARTAMKARQIFVSGMGRALAGLGDVTGSDISSDVSGAVNVAQDIGSGDYGKAIGAGVGLVSSAIKTGQDASKSGSGGSSSGSSSSTAPWTIGTPRMILDQMWDGTRAGIAKLHATADGKHAAKDVQQAAMVQYRRAEQSASKSKANQPATAYIVKNGAWTAVGGHYAADGVHFKADADLPTGTPVVMTTTGLPPTIDPSKIHMRVIGKTAAGASVAAPASASSKLPILAVAAGGALLLARHLMGG